jgi:hypothetical protein
MADIGNMRARPVKWQTVRGLLSQPDTDTDSETEEDEPDTEEPDVPSKLTVMWNSAQHDMFSLADQRQSGLLWAATLRPKSPAELLRPVEKNHCRLAIGIAIAHFHEIFKTSKSKGVWKSYLHGDFSPSNVFYDVDNNCVAMIDNYGMGITIKQKGRRVLMDVKRMMGSLSQRPDLQKAFLEGYCKVSEMKHGFITNILDNDKTLSDRILDDKGGDSDQ